jgi:hypothetical protein
VRALGASCKSLQGILAAFDAARREVETRKGSIEAIWLDASVDDQFRAVLIRERQAKAGNDAGVPQALPERYFIVESFHLEDTHGRLAGTLGPRSSPATMGACGTGFTLVLHRDQGNWRAQVATIRLC